MIKKFMKRNLAIILMFLGIIFTIFGSSLAYLSWQTAESQQTNVVFTVTADFSCAVDGGGNITQSDAMIAPAPCTSEEYAIQREVKVSPSVLGQVPVYMDLWINVDEIGTGLSESQNFRYAMTTSNSSCTEGVVASGNFNGKTVGDTVSLLDGKLYTATMIDTYYLYIWLDVEETSTATMDQTFSLSLGGLCTGDPTAAVTGGDSSVYSEEILNGAVPVLDNTGMIPVTISNDGVVTTVSSSSSDWYNYENKEWANAVLVTESSRSNYLNTSGETVSSSDILAYYVWIPKYSYKMNGTEESISISFNSTPSGYISHPAFDFDSGTTGMWVGKFETTGSASSPTVLPSVQPLVSQTVSAEFQTSLLFSGGTLSDGNVSFSGSDTYGLSSTTDSHMMKNSEWGAVAYLSHSVYGINDEIRINNYYSSGYKTGCGASSADASSSTSCEIAYGGATSYPQSTTGNISGIFDMSGGVWEYVMGVFANSDGTLWSGYSTTYNSGFTGLYGSSSEGPYEGIAFPDEKYYDVYKASSGTTISSTTACDGGVCYGHALSETSGWYSDYAYFVSSTNPWFLRGGLSYNGSNAGAFASSSAYGPASSNGGFRSVLVA